MNHSILEIDISDFLDNVKIDLQREGWSLYKEDMLCFSSASRELLGAVFLDENSTQFSGCLYCVNSSGEYNIFQIKKGFSTWDYGCSWVKQIMKWYLKHGHHKIEENIKTSLRSALIKNIVEIIKEYRKDELEEPINYEHVDRWISQFEEQDQEFILREFLYVLPSSYLSKVDALSILDKVFEKLRIDFNYDDIHKLLDHTCFLSCQPDYKSQSILLEYFDALIIESYGRSVNDCGSKEIRYWIYVDDVLGSGGTCRRDLTSVINDYNVDDFEKSGILIICIFFIIHNWGETNCKFSLKQNIGEFIDGRIRFYRVGTIENNPRLHKHYNPEPKFNHLYPKRCDEGEEFLNFIEGAFDRNYQMSNEQYAFRSEGHPIEELTFSSQENRNRYELIMLKKGVEIINSINNLRSKGLRPLGMTSPSHKTLGLGTHFFTWRNISNTCPLVFWWETNGWHPLFPVKNRGK